jgi:hypothetical protein
MDEHRIYLVPIAGTLDATSKATRAVSREVQFIAQTSCHQQLSTTVLALIPLRTLIGLFRKA